MGKKYSGGVKTATGFKMEDPQPVADYMVVESLDDLQELENQFIGMETYVLETDTNWIKTSVGWKESGKTTIITVSEDTVLIEAYKSCMIIVDADVLITVSAGLSGSFITDIDAKSPFRLETAPGVFASGNMDGAVMPYNVPKNGQISIFSQGENAVRIKGDIL